MTNNGYAKVSVIIPVYNSEKYLQHAIESVISQTLTELEIILVDDGSTDRSTQILDKYEAFDQRIKLIHLNRSGAGEARNAGIDIAGGKYIAFVDSDDWIEHTMLERLYDIAERNNCNIVMCDMTIEYQDGSQTSLRSNKIEQNIVLDKEYIREEFCRLLLTNGVFTSCCDKLYQAEWLKKHRLLFRQQVDIREDFFFCLDVFDCCDQTFYLPAAMYHYSVASRKIGRRYHNNFYRISMELFRLKIKYAMKWKLNKTEVMHKMADDLLLDLIESIRQISSRRLKCPLAEKHNRVMQIINDKTTREEVAISSCVEDANEESRKENAKWDKHSLIHRFLLWLIKQRKGRILLLLFIGFDFFDVKLGFLRGTVNQKTAFRE